MKFDIDRKIKDFSIGSKDARALLAAKVAFFVYILLSPFVDHRAVAFLNALPAKILLLAIIVGASFVDLQLAIIMTLAFLILIINLNKEAIFGIRNAGVPTVGISEHFAVNLPTPGRDAIASDTRDPPESDTMTAFPDRCDAFNGDRERVSKDLYDLYIDPKIKPYEMYIKALSHPDAIENAADSAAVGAYL